jgi:hypothetical protein
MRDFPATKPVDATEPNRITDGDVRGLPDRFETDAEVLSALVTDQRSCDPRRSPQQIKRHPAPWRRRSRCRSHP